VATTDEYYAARDERDRAREHLQSLAQKLTALANTLRDARGVRLNEQTGYAGPPPNHIPVDQSALVTWEQLEPAIRTFTQADDALRHIESNLTPDQRRQMNR
jgi:hypothetical protein